MMKNPNDGKKEEEKDDKKPAPKPPEKPVLKDGGYKDDLHEWWRDPPGGEG